MKVERLRVDSLIRSQTELTAKMAMATTDQKTINLLLINLYAILLAPMYFR